MEIEIKTEDVDEVDPEEIATLLIEAGYYVASVRVVGRRAGQDERRWEDGNG